MKTIILSFLLLFFFQSSFAQYLPPNNLVVNPHFNNYTYHIIPNYYDVCPYPRIRCGYQNPTSLMYHALCLENWIKPTMGHSGWVHHDSCDYYGYPLPPLGGKGISLVHLVNDTDCTTGYYINYRKYIQGILNDTLKTGYRYCASMYILFDNRTFFGIYPWGSNIYFTSSVGILFTDTPIYRNDASPFNEFYPPQIENPLDRFLTDSLNWMLVSGSFYANGGEKYLTIGNFLLDSESPNIRFRENIGPDCGYGAYLIGFVGVNDCTGHSYQCNAGEDMRICNGQVVQLGTDEDNRRQYHWSPATGLSDTTAARPLASPSETTTYNLYVIDEFLQQSYDTVTVEVVQCEIFIPNIFSPNNDGENDVLYVRGQGIEQLSFVVYNRWGQKVFETKDPNHGWDGTHNGKPAETGVYVWHVHAKLEDGLEMRRSGNVTLVR